MSEWARLRAVCFYACIRGCAVRGEPDARMPWEPKKVCVTGTLKFSSCDL